MSPCGEEASVSAMLLSSCRQQAAGVRARRGRCRTIGISFQDARRTRAGRDVPVHGQKHGWRLSFLRRDAGVCGACICRTDARRFVCSSEGAEGARSLLACSACLRPREEMGRREPFFECTRTAVRAAFPALGFECALRSLEQWARPSRT
ncbi:hypothetical protein K438DRAFT_2019764 [Mycena galopus ATCC 62051]|nr:hypothetical protein K438DRAFT_2019764 [Mycena galopus ATCC 62051]